MKPSQAIVIIVSSLVLVAAIMGGLIFFLVWYSDYTDSYTPGKPVKIACDEEHASFLCLIRQYLHPSTNRQ